MKIYPKNQIVFTLFMLPGTYVIPASEVFDNPNEWGDIVLEWEAIQKALEENEARLKDALLSAGNWEDKAQIHQAICDRILENNKAREKATMALAKAIDHDALLSKCNDIQPYETALFVYVFVDDDTPLIPWESRHQYLHPYRDSVELAKILSGIEMRLDVRIYSPSLWAESGNCVIIKDGEGVIEIHGGNS